MGGGGGGGTVPCPPEKIRNRHIPADIVEEILLILPVKSLVRFSSVSKSWNSMIFGSRFAKRYRGRERILTIPYFYDDLNHFCWDPILSESDNSINELATDHINCPFQQRLCHDHDFKRLLHIMAYTNELWCVESAVDKSLFLWNPSTRRYRKLPNPTIRPRTYGKRTLPLLRFQFSYGLGYDSVGDDYKILKIRKDFGQDHEAELYSLRRNSWRKIQPFPFPERRISTFFGSFVSGALHWAVRLSVSLCVIISFDLSTEKYGEVALPDYFPTLESYDDVVDVAASSGKLCLSLNCFHTKSIALWVMEDYGVVESWTKKFDIDSRSFHNMQGIVYRWRPLYFCDNGQIVISLTTQTTHVYSYNYNDNMGIYVCKGDKALPMKNFLPSRFCENHRYGLFCVESLVQL